MTEQIKDEPDSNGHKSGHEAEIGKLLQNETRYGIVMYLRMNKRLNYGDIVRLTGKSKSTVHHHLQKLIKGGLVQEIETPEPRDQFTPKSYELVPNPKRIYDFSTISSLPVEQQVSALLTTTKLHQYANLNLHQILDVFSNFLDGIDKKIVGNDHVDPEELKNILDHKSDDVSLKFNDIHFYSIKVSEIVYQEYKREMEKIYTKLSALVKEEKAKKESVAEPHFIYHVAAPLGKQFVLKPQYRKKTTKRKFR